MATLDEMKLAMVPEYQEKYDALYKVAFELHRLKEDELEMAVIKRMAGLKQLIDHCSNAGKV